MGLTVVEVLGRSVQGRTQPYICRCDDGEIYFVKGRSATRAGLSAEWLCVRLGDAIGLPVAPYAMAMVPEELMEADLTGWLSDLGSGEVFASRRVHAVDLTEVHRNRVPQQQRRDVLAFDWWVHNADRTLTVKGGNANLLWNPANAGSLVVIDHNLAFDPAFSTAQFCQLHVFSDDIAAMFHDGFVREGYRARFQAALNNWDEYCDSLPASWAYVDLERTIPASLPLTTIKALLDRAQTDIFWQLP